MYVVIIEVARFELNDKLLHRKNESKWWHCVSHNTFITSVGFIFVKGKKLPNKKSIKFSNVSYEQQNFYEFLTESKLKMYEN